MTQYRRVVSHFSREWDKNRFSGLGSVDNKVVVPRGGIESPAPWFSVTGSRWRSLFFLSTYLWFLQAAVQPGHRLARQPLGTKFAGLH